MGKKQHKTGKHPHWFFVCIIIMPILICGCGHFQEEFLARSTFSEARNFFSQGSYDASLNKYEQIINKYPTETDKALFGMGIIYAYPKNEQKNYQKSLECFQRLLRDYPESGYRHDSEMMIFHINNVITKDKMIRAQQTQIETLQREVVSRENEIIAQQKKIEELEREVKRKGDEILTQQNKIEALEQKVFAFLNGPADKILIEKKERRLTLLLKDKALRTYKIALGGNPIGPKERQGDNKTPEGTYIIDAKKKDSLYHLSLHISYPNEKDRKRAKELGLSPGGDIMIHGIKNGFSSIGESHTKFDWTRGCIAVTDEEIEEINNLAPTGTTVEIRP